MEILPSVWRNPDRVYDAGDGHVCLETDSLEGDHFRMIVKCSKQAPRMKTFYRTSEPYMEKK